MRKSPWTSGISLTAAAALVLTACGGGDEPEAADGEVAGQIQFAWWGGPARNERTQAVIDLYEDEHPDVSVSGTTEEFGAYWENASVQAAGGNLPCVPQMQNRTMADYGDRGALRPLDDLVDSGQIDISGIPEHIIDSGRGADGQLYMIPYGAAFASLLVNETQIEEYGLELPPEEYDWEWLAEWLQDISEEAEAPAVGIVGEQIDAAEVWVRSHGENLYEEGEVGFTQETLYEFWQYSDELRDAGAAISAEQASEQSGLPLEQTPFTQGRQATLFWPANGLGAAQETIDSDTESDYQLGVYPMPMGPEGAGHAFWLSGLAISENCENVATAASFIDFFVNDEEAAIAFAADNGANVHEENLQTLIDHEDTSEVKRAELELYQQIVEQDVDPTTYGRGYASVFQDALARYYEQASFGQLTLEDAAEQFYEEAVSTINN